MTVAILTGDCRDILRTLPDESVHCVVTSPPYWGLRDYGTAKWEGGDTGCDHRRFNGYTSGLVGTTEAQDKGKFFKNICEKCGATRIDSQLGLEPSLSEHVDNMVGVFREVRRILRKDGTLWLNYGDSYFTSPPGNDFSNPKNNFQKNARHLNGVDRKKIYNIDAKRAIGLKPKDLCGIPWRVAFALQADGWYLRSDIIWAKPNPMPESVTDRPTKAHEYIFLMSKSERYFYDAEAIKEDANPQYEARYASAFYTGKKEIEGCGRPDGGASNTAGMKNYTGKRNRRTVWEIATSPFSEAHFATFPPALIEPCIMAGCPGKCCARCGAPWTREVAVGWHNSCGCIQGPPIPGTVLDPFGGAGTTGLVADRLGRNAILIELNPEYAAMAERRISNDAGMFAQISYGGAAE